MNYSTKNTPKTKPGRGMLMIEPGVPAMKKGGAVIFDELSVHRGSKPTKNDRVVLRYLFNKKSK